MITLKIEKNGTTTDVELKLTRLAIIHFNRKGMLDMSEAEKNPMVYLYTLAYAATYYAMLGLKQSDVDAALEGYFENGGTFQELSDELHEQYQTLFNIDGGEGVSQK